MAKPENFAPSRRRASVVLASYLRACEAAFEELGPDELVTFARTTDPSPCPSWRRGSSATRSRRATRAPGERAAAQLRFQRFAQSPSSRIAGSSSAPIAVSSYETRGGVPVVDRALDQPGLPRARAGAARAAGRTGRARPGRSRRSRAGPAASVQRIAPAQRLPISSTAAWKSGQTGSGRAASVPVERSVRDRASTSIQGNGRPSLGPTRRTAPVSAPSERAAERPGDDPVRDAEAARRAVVERRREHGGDHAAVAVDHRAARVAAAHHAAERRHLPPDRPAAVGVLADNAPRSSEPRGGERQRPALRIADRRGGRPAPRIGGERRAARPVEPGDAQHREVVAGLVVDDVRVELVAGRAWSPSCRPGRRRRGRWSRRVSGPAIQPEPSTPSPQALPRTRRTEAAARSTSGSLEDAARRARATSASGPRTSGLGSIRRSTFRSGPDGGKASFSAARIDERWTASRRSRAPFPGAFSATAPNTHAAASARAASSTAPPSESARLLAEPRREALAQPRPDALERDRQEDAQQDAAGRGDRRRVRRLGPAVEQRGREAPADRDTRDEARPGASPSATRPRSQPIAASASAKTTIPMSIALMPFAR